MLPTDLLNLLSQVSPLSFGLALLAGLVMGFSPAAFPMWAFVTGSILGSEELSWNRALALSLGFSSGITTIWAAFGVLVALAGGLISRGLQLIMSSVPLWNLLIGLLLVPLGLHMAGLVRLRIPALITPVERRVSGTTGAYLVGLSFGLGACPSCLPILLSVLVAVGAVGQAWYGAAVLLAFSMGFAIPLALVSVSAGLLKRARRLSRYARLVGRVGGWVLLGVSAYFLIQFFRLSAV